MKAAWSGTVEEFIKLADEDVLIPRIEAGYQDHFKKVPGSSEISSWAHSAALLHEILADEKWRQLRIYFEYPMPSGEQRADIVLLGGTESNVKGLLLEFKRWTTFDCFADAENRKPPRRIRLSKSEDMKTVLHPLLQAHRYTLQIANGSQVGSRFSWSYFAVLPNLAKEERKRLLNTRALPKDSEKRLLGKENYKEGILEKCLELLPAQISDSLSTSFEVSGYAPSQDLIDTFTQKAPALIGQLNSVRDIEIEPTNAQMKLCQSVVGAIGRNERKLFLVEGGPGSGKTYVALLLLLRSLAAGRTTKLAVYSSRLLTILEDCLEGIANGASALIMNIGAISHQIRKSQLDLLICDEGQRFSEQQIRKLLERAKTIVVFYDEQQRLNPSEQGSKALFKHLAKPAGFEPVEVRLEQMMRCRGGNEYHRWIERLIQGHITENDKAKTQNWSNAYSFEVVDTCKQMIDRLKSYSAKNKVVVVASFTESPGDWNNLTSTKNIRFQDNKLTLYWWMYDHEYIEPWTYGRAEDLNRVCSIYGTQGFESDYVGVIWGKDYIFDKTKFTLGDPNNCFDNGKGLVASNEWCEDALSFLQNRYRIFLTRGRLGTIIFAEDEKTRDYLRTTI